MKKVLIFMISLVFLAGCTNHTGGKSRELKIIDAVTSMAGTPDRQELDFEFTINNLKHSIQEDSLELVLSDWTNERLIDKQISKIKYNQTNIYVEGYIKFDSTGLTKELIEEHQPLIKGFNLKDNSGRMIFLKYEP